MRDLRRRQRVIVHSKQIHLTTPTRRTRGRRSVARAEEVGCGIPVVEVKRSLLVGSMLHPVHITLRITIILILHIVHRFLSLKVGRNHNVDRVWVIREIDEFMGLDAIPSSRYE